MAHHDFDDDSRTPGLGQLLELLRNPDVQAGLAEFAGLHIVTDADKAVLDASGEVVVDNLVAIASRNGRRMARWARAELARRNGKTGPTSGRAQQEALRGFAQRETLRGKYRLTAAEVEVIVDAELARREAKR